MIARLVKNISLAVVVLLLYSAVGRLTFSLVRRYYPNDMSNEWPAAIFWPIGLPITAGILLTDHVVGEVTR